MVAYRIPALCSIDSLFVLSPFFSVVSPVKNGKSTNLIATLNLNNFIHQPVISKVHTYLPTWKIISHQGLYFVIHFMK